VIAGDLHRLAEGTAGSVGDLQTNGWLRQTGGTGRSDTGIRPTLHSPVVQVHTQRLQNTICIMGTECEYVLKDSVWDASIFMMCRFFPSQEMYLFLAAVVLNLVLQVILSATVMHLGGKGSDYSDSILADWAIWAEDVDEVERQKVCSGSYSLSTSTLQWIALDAAQEYTSSYSGIVGRGSLLCVGVVTVWCANCLNLIRDLGDLMLAVVALTDWSPNASLHITHELMNFKIHSICKRRLAWMLLLIMLQSFVLFLLVFWGSRWFIYTSEVSDLLLNAVALGFITDTDEILFKLCVPTRLQVVTARTEPLRVYSLRRPTPFRSLASIFSVVLFVVVVTLVFSIDEDDRRTRGLSILCP